MRQVVVLLGREPGATEWGVRNNHISGESVEKQMAEAQKQLQGWLAATPDHEFSIVTVDWGHEYARRGH